MASIFEQIGGAAAVTAAVDDFYERVLGDPTLEKYFAESDMTKLKAHQRSFMAAALGGPQEYRGKTMAEAHAGMGITSEEFGAVVQHLVNTLQALGVPDETIGAIGSALAPLEEEIVGSEAGVPAPSGGSP